MQDLVKAYTSIDAAVNTISGSAINIGFDGNIKTLTLTADTTLTLTGSWFPMDYVVILASGDYLLSLNTTGLTVHGLIDDSDVLTNYNGRVMNEVIIMNVGVNTFTVTINNLG